METLEKFKVLFLDVWNDGISGVNISEILIALVIFLFSFFFEEYLQNLWSKDWRNMFLNPVTNLIIP